jgi:hypothetical protein
MPLTTLTMPVEIPTAESNQCEALSRGVFPESYRCKRRTWVRIGGAALCTQHIGTFIVNGEIQLHDDRALLDTARKGNR